MAYTSDQDVRRQMTPVVLSSMIGTAIEWYDFFLYGTMASLVFPKVFFPETDPVVGTLLALVTFLVGFIARPIGGAIFGHLGDRIGVAIGQQEVTIGEQFGMVGHRRAEPMDEATIRTDFNQPGLE